MDFLKHFDTNTIFIIVGALMLLGCFATVQGGGSQYNDDFEIILLIAGFVCLAIGFGFIDIRVIKEAFKINKG